MKRLLVITTPDFLPNEGEILTLLFKEGMERLHLRKPESSLAQLRKLLQQIPSLYHPHIVLHDHFGLAKEFAMGGIHLNRRNPEIPDGYAGGSISRSCHSLQEVKESLSVCDYVFLSPIFPSISKEGYGSGFPLDTLQQAGACGQIDDRVIALGGIDRKTLPLLKDIPFGGYALLGAIWGNHQLVESIINNFKSIHESVWQ